MRKFADKQARKEQRTKNRQTKNSNTESTLILSGYSRELANIVSRDEKVKLIVEIIEDALALEYELDNCKNKKDMDSVEQDDLEIIWEKIRQDYNTWSEIRRQGNDWCVNSIQVDGDWSVVDRSQVVWRECTNYWYFICVSC